MDVFFSQPLWVQVPVIVCVAVCFISWAIVAILKVIDLFGLERRVAILEEQVRKLKGE